MTDDVDDMLRRAMKSLDGDVPSGYFEALPQRTLARLEDDNSMQTTPTSPQESDQLSAGVPPKQDDSGLHDIRSLAQSTKQRLSARISTVPPMDEDALASSSASWRNAIALPEPARMVSLPELASLPSRKEIIAKDKAAKKAKTEGTTSAPVAAASSASTAVTPISAPRAAKDAAASKRARTMALAGIGLAAAAGAAIFVAVQGGGKADTAQRAIEAAPPAAKAEVAKPAAATGQAAPAPVATPTVPDEAANSPAIGAAAETPPPPTMSKGDAGAKNHASAKLKESGKDADKLKTEKPSGGEKKPQPGKISKDGKEAKDGEPSFDELLKEAGVNEKKPQQPKLERKSLSGGDIKQGMGSVAGKAQACYAGTQGTASVKLTVAPSGQVQKVTVSGPFAGTAVAGCVEAAVRSASFPAWDGGPQSINYSYLLSE